MLDIRIDGLTKRYGQKTAVCNLSLEVPAGTLLCLLGRNGAGKTTLIHALMGLVHATSGDAWIGGVSIGSPHIRAVRRRIGFLPEESALYEHLTGREFLQFIDALYDPQPAVQDRVSQVLDEIGMAGEADRLVRTYSKGMKRRIAIAAALLPDPDLLLFDEPTGSLDAVSSRTVKIILERFRDRGRTVVFTTHILEMAERLADRFAVLDEGALRFTGTLAEMRERFAGGANAPLEELFLQATGEGCRNAPDACGVPA